MPEHPAGASPKKVDIAFFDTKKVDLRHNSGTPGRNDGDRKRQKPDSPDTPASSETPSPVKIPVGRIASQNIAATDRNFDTALEQVRLDPASVEKFLLCYDAWSQHCNEERAGQLEALLADPSKDKIKFFTTHEENHAKISASLCGALRSLTCGIPVPAESIRAMVDQHSRRFDASWNQ